MPDKHNGLVLLTDAEAVALTKMASNGRDYVDDQDMLYAGELEKDTARETYDWLVRNLNISVE